MRSDLLARTTTILLPLMLAAQPGRAADSSVDYCIHCSNPDDIYVCRIHSAGGSAEGQQFLCIMNIAQQFKHDACTAEAHQDVCTGRLVEYEATTPPPIAPDDGMEASAPAYAATPPAASETKEPRTLVEFSKQTAKATQSSIKSVGETTGKAINKTGEQIDTMTDKLGHKLKKVTVKTMNCITSLFTKCGE
jgi:hypothetical protein